jgi:NADPH:quinone reductase-like Zn-dependent oxidoreductase
LRSMKQVQFDRMGEPATVARVCEVPAPALASGHVRLRMPLRAGESG